MKIREVVRKAMTLAVTYGDSDISLLLDKHVGYVRTYVRQLKTDFPEYRFKVSRLRFAYVRVYAELKEGHNLDEKESMIRDVLKRLEPIVRKAIEAEQELLFKNIQEAEDDPEVLKKWWDA